MKPTPEQIAARFGCSVDQVKRQFSKNAQWLRKAEKLAGSGTYRGMTAVDYRRAANHAEKSAKSV